MRVVLVVCGALAAAIALLAVWAGCREEREASSPAVVTRPPGPHDESESSSEPVVRRPGISLRAFSVGDVLGPNGYSSTTRSITVAVFPTDAGAPALSLAKCDGECELDVPAGRYDVCVGGSLSCKRVHPRDELDFWCDPATEKDCRCVTPPGARAAWTGPCQRVEVADHLVRVVVSTGAVGATSFQCSAPGDVCR